MLTERDEQRAKDIKVAEEAAKQSKSGGGAKAQGLLVLSIPTYPHLCIPKP
jgi:hypothetical protein